MKYNYINKLKTPMLNKYDLKEKEFLKKQRELNELYEKRKEIEWVELKEPYQRGWTIYYELRDDIKRREDADKIQRAMELGYGIAHTRSEAHVRNVRRGDKVKSVINPSRKNLRLKDIPDDLKKYFVADYQGILNKRDYQIAIPRYWFTRKVKPFIVTHTRDCSIDREISKLQNELYISGKYIDIAGHRWKWHTSFPIHKLRVETRDQIRKFLNGETEDISIEKYKRAYE
jgi:hypothetical protein